MNLLQRMKALILKRLKAVNLKQMILEAIIPIFKYLLLPLILWHRAVPSRLLHEVPCHHFWPEGLSLFQLQTSQPPLYPHPPHPLHPSHRYITICYFFQRCAVSNPLHCRRRLTTMSLKSSLHLASVSRPAPVPKRRPVGSKRRPAASKKEPQTQN